MVRARDPVALALMKPGLADTKLAHTRATAKGWIGAVNRYRSPLSAE